MLIYYNKEKFNLINNQNNIMKLIKRIIKKVFLLPVIHLYKIVKEDYFDLWLGKRDKMTPPLRLIKHVGDATYETFWSIGERYFNLFTKKFGLKPTDDVLDVGCGVGKLARFLSGYLEPTASYNGFDISTNVIEWAKKNIAPLHPNIHFQVADLYSKRYNPKGKYQPDEYIFPFEDDSFDFIFLNSVFTHMLPKELEHYLSEISRVLRKGGRISITYFLLDDEGKNAIKEGKDVMGFKYDFGIYRTVHDVILQAAVCYDENYIKDIYSKFGLEIQEPIYRGMWRGGPDTLNLGRHDLILATKN